MISSTNSLRDFEPAARPSLSRPRLRHRQRHGEEKGGAVAGVAFDPDLAPEVLDDAAADRETEAGAHRVPRAAGAYLVELLENLLLFAVRDAGTVVGDPDDGRAVHRLEIDRHPAGAGGTEFLRV